MTGQIAKLNKPKVYWDRTQKVVRDWDTNQALPEYEGTCMVYLDTRGPVFMETFLRHGERCWQGADVIVQQISD